MDFTLVINALKLVVYLSVPLLLAVMGGALVAGILKVSTQIDDHSIGFTGRLAGAVIAIYFAAGFFSSEVISFTLRVWGGGDFYK